VLEGSVKSWGKRVEGGVGGLERLSPECISSKYKGSAYISRGKKIRGGEQGAILLLERSEE